MSDKNYDWRVQFSCFDNKPIESLKSSYREAALACWNLKDDLSSSLPEFDEPGMEIRSVRIVTESIDYVKQVTTKPEKGLEVRELKVGFCRVRQQSLDKPFWEVSASVQVGIKILENIPYSEEIVREIEIVKDWIDKIFSIV